MAADLSANENPWGASPEAAGAIAASAVTVHRYPDSKGAALKAALAERLSWGGSAIVSDTDVFASGANSYASNVRVRSL